VFPIPAQLDDGTALAIVLQGLTAWHLYRTAARVADGESVVVHAAAGGVGSLAVQLGHSLGAGRVIATASSAEKRSLALELGADAAVEPTPECLDERLIEANEGRLLDVVFEMAGGEVFEASYRALAPFGRIVVCGIASQQPNHPSTGSLLRHSRTVVGFWVFHCLERPGMLTDALSELFARAARGELRAVVGHTYPLEQAAQAHIDLRERRTTGKLLLDPAA
jgi:NADPH2:quinone reductase